MIDVEEEGGCGHCHGPVEWRLFRLAGAVFTDEIAIDDYFASCTRRCAESAATGNARRREKPKAHDHLASPRR